MPKLSIIVPIYNVDNYLPRCLKSLLTQAYDDFELILVDDGSADSCGLILDVSILNDSRILVIHQKNKGVSAARNAGLSIARGKYVGFVDPDDWIEPDMYKILVNAIEIENCDIAGCSWMDNYLNGEERRYASQLKTQAMSREEFAKHLFDAPPTLGGSVCSKIIRREKILSRFSERYFIGEDHLFLARYIVGCKRGIYVNKPLYHVFFRSDSATRDRPGKVVYGLAARKEIIDVVKTISDECGMLAEKLYLDQCISFIIREDLAGSFYQEYARKEYIDYLSENKAALFKNRMIKWKQKLFYYFQFIKHWLVVKTAYEGTEH